MRPLLHELRLFFTALQFFTRCPIPAWVGYQAEWLQQCARYFPAVGTVVGAWAALVIWGASWIWPAGISAGLGLAASIWLTGGFHEDGWADSCDGLGGAVSREKALLIMKDSRIGSYAALGLILMLGLKAACLVALLDFNPDLALLATLWAHTASRAAPVALMHRLGYAGDAEHAKAKPLTTQAGGASLVFALLWVLALSGLIAWVQPHLVPSLCAAWLAIALVTFAMQGFLERRLGGCTGDTLGATQQLAELAGLLAFVGLINVF